MTLDSEEFEDWDFEDWVKGWFDNPDDWNWQEDYDNQPRDLSPLQTVAHATRLFETAGETLAPYSDHQIGQSLWAFINEIDSPLYALRDDVVPTADRLRCLSAISGVYEQVFVARCEERIGNENNSELYLTCFMWWDIFPSSPRRMTEEENRVTLDVMERALALPHAVCQESAIHGLGHWHRAGNDRPVRILDAFLASGMARQPELIEYARQARGGRIQ